MNGLPYYKAYPRDFIEGTIGMPFEMKCAYRVVLDLIYMQGGSLPDDARYISGLLGCSIRKWKTIRQFLVDADKVQVSGDFLTNYRAENELETLAKLQDKQRENRARPNKNKGLQSPPSDQPEPEPESEPDLLKRDTVVSPKKPRATRLSEQWTLPRDWGEWALSEGWSETVIRLEAEKFKDFWIAKAGKDAAKLDWKATWRNWLRNSKTPKTIKGGQYGKGTDSSERLNAFVAGARGAS